MFWLNVPESVFQLWRVKFKVVSFSFSFTRKKNKHGGINNAKLEPSQHD